MAYVVTDVCIKDFRCVNECALDAIAPKADDPTAGEVSQVFINPDVCAECGACMMVCEQKAISSPESLAADKAHFIEKNAAYFQ